MKVRVKVRVSLRVSLRARLRSRVGGPGLGSCRGGAEGEPRGVCLRVPAEPPRAKYKSPCVWSRFRCLFGSFGEEHELVARNRSKKNEQKTSEP